MKNWKFIGSKHINFISLEQIEACSKELDVEIICILPEESGVYLNWQQVMLDERYAAYGYWVTEEHYREAGGRNEKLTNGWQYELLIRLAENRTVGCMADGRVEKEWAAVSDFYTDVYILGRYVMPLREWNCFDAFLESCVEAVLHSEHPEEDMSYLEGMLGRNRRYWELYQATQPFLILLGDDFCYNILNDMALNLAQGLILCGKSVEVLDLAKDKRKKLARLPGTCYQAVIGFQSFLSSIYLSEKGCYLTDLIQGPKLEMVFDHPFWFYEQLERHGSEFYVLTHDENYVEYIRRYEPSVSGSFLLPPGGVVCETGNVKRDLDVVFLGTYNNYREIIDSLYLCDPNIRHMAARYLKYLKLWVNQPAEQAFWQMLKEYGIETEREQFVRMMYQMGNVCQCMMYYYREKMIQTLLDAKISLHVYGESWKNSPFADSEYLICHEEVAAENSFCVLQRAKISLNILAWHKGGCNERIINSMLAGAALITDKSSYIEKHFLDGRELCCYDLQELEKLPELVTKLLRQDDDRQQMAENGRRKAAAEYSTEAQAKRLLAIMEQMNNEIP